VKLKLEMEIEVIGHSVKLKGHLCGDGACFPFVFSAPSLQEALTSLQGLIQRHAVEGRPLTKKATSR
jgi:hypothetical protein